MQTNDRHRSALEKNSFTYFNIGMIIAISLAIVAFRYETPYEEPKPITIDPIEDILVLPPQTIQEPPKQLPEPPPMQKQAPSPLINIVETLPPIEFEPAPPIEPLAPEKEGETEIDLPPVPKGPMGLYEVHNMPEFPGGNEALMEYLSEAPYCDVTKDLGIEGKIFISIVLGKDGKVKDAKIERGIHKCADQMIKKYVENMPAWEPATHHGYKVEVNMVVPFKLKIK